SLIVFSEGKKTEPNYLDGFKSDFSVDPRAIQIKKSKHTDPKGIINQAISYKKENGFTKDDQMWVIYDRESVEKYSHEYHLEARTLAQKNGVFIAFSNICFEQWLIYHFLDSSRSYSSYSNLISESELTKKMAEIGIPKYDKGENIYSKLIPFIDTAIRNAKKIREQLDQTNPDMHPAEKGGYVDIDLLLEAIKLINS
ncbi:RloB family protein, partial [Acinetobacter baumannii]|nr:RloB family protein [Acinetobacter baumannii]